MALTKKKSVTVLALLVAGTGLAACDQPVDAPSRPRPVAVVPQPRSGDRASQEAHLREIVALLVAQSKTPEGSAALRPKQELAVQQLEATLAAPPESAERVSLDELLARLRALSAAPAAAQVQSPASGSR
ncbi:MAG TPA: hypothetical protein VFS20_16675 [Longimicrobium sp.]|nr:hypothetical protein [Longimicrobium sp.]